MDKGTIVISASDASSNYNFRVVQQNQSQQTISHKKQANKSHEIELDFFREEPP